MGSCLQEHALRVSLAPVGAQQHAARQVGPIVCTAQQSESLWHGLAGFDLQRLRGSMRMCSLDMPCLFGCLRFRVDG